MSSAFVREQDDQWLEDVRPTVQALRNFLTRENNGVSIYEQSMFTDTEGREIHIMSNGLSYWKDLNGKWQVMPS